MGKLRRILHYFHQSRTLFISLVLTSTMLTGCNANQNASTESRDVPQAHTTLGYTAADSIPHPKVSLHVLPDPGPCTAGARAMIHEWHVPPKGGEATEIVETIEKVSDAYALYPPDPLCIEVWSNAPVAITVDGASVGTDAMPIENGRLLVAYMAPDGPHDVRLHVPSMPDHAATVRLFMPNVDVLGEGVSLYFIEDEQVTLVPDEASVVAIAGATFAFPVGSVHEPIDIYMQARMGPPHLGPNIDLFPHGIQFQKPVSVSLPYLPERLPSQQNEDVLLSRNALAIMHNDEFIETRIDAGANMAFGAIEHFSTVKVAATETLTNY